MLPGRKDPRAPAPWPEPPQRTASRAGGSLTMVMSASEEPATSSGELASLAPAATSDSAREAVRFQTVKEYPAFNRFNPIGRPIRPSPINPTFEPGPMIRFGPGLVPGPILTPGPMLVVGRVSGVTKASCARCFLKPVHRGQNVGWTAATIVTESARKSAAEGSADP